MQRKRDCGCEVSEEEMSYCDNCAEDTYEMYEFLGAELIALRKEAGVDFAPIDEDDDVVEVVKKELAKNGCGLFTNSGERVWNTIDWLKEVNQPNQCKPVRAERR